MRGLETLSVIIVIQNPQLLVLQRFSRVAVVWTRIYDVVILDPIQRPTLTTNSKMELRSQILEMLIRYMVEVLMEVSQL